MTEDQPVELAFNELAEIIREKDERALSFDKYLKHLEETANAAVRKLEVARSVAGICEATKTRKPRKDRGVKRKKVTDATTPANGPPAALGSGHTADPSESAGADQPVQ